MLKIACTANHRLADWYEKSGIARFTERMERRAKGYIEMSRIHRNELFGTFCAMDTIRIVSSSGGPLNLRLNMRSAFHANNSPSNADSYLGNCATNDLQMWAQRTLEAKKASQERLERGGGFGEEPAFPCCKGVRT
ncbi:hypothetical protein ACVIHI_009115 [Bradyrhizobium sp. USDA 4524]|uniref:hypothetical protein n=1 Tax=unclassified Bradyrhizobium TaxID=2631580 RepID=UPI0020A07DFB|nr:MULTISPECIES: hypothetical protein [unclassified Bradyrhizobium]MCP1846106.1 hypothetical protein [Bradyrhizobium sp. USDA 4538]MCP1907260.1 hypothetical protein [Bradyrhizobium sp. USDA 4537]MCP1985735.1 hypothetical protein [Bradyrhizobium sp. USDA 4539]